MYILLTVLPMTIFNFVCYSDAIWTADCYRASEYQTILSAIQMPFEYQTVTGHLNTGHSIVRYSNVWYSDPHYIMYHNIIFYTNIQPHNIHIHLEFCHSLQLSLLLLIDFSTFFLLLFSLRNLVESFFRNEPNFFLVKLLKNCFR